MQVTRRSFLKATGATAAALGLHVSGATRIQQAMAAEGGPSVVWLQGQGCTGCSVSLLNSIYYATIDDLLVNTLDLQYDTTVMAGAGAPAVAAAQAALNTPGFVLCVEGAIPTADNGLACTIWPGMTMLNALQTYGPNAGLVLAIGACASYGGISHGNPNPTAAKAVQDILPNATLINLPGCPAHPDWVVGTIAYYLQNKAAPPLDANKRPTSFYTGIAHLQCPRLGHAFATSLGQEGTPCLMGIGCKGPQTTSDCPHRMWNSGGAGQFGVNFCMGSGSPCIGCTEPTFPDGMSPFFVL